MKLRSILIAAAVTAGVAIAHHVAVPLSYISGEEILTEIDVYLDPTKVGVPSYKVADDESPHVVSLSHGDRFWVIDGVHTPQLIEFRAEDFGDITHASDHEVVDVINAQIDFAKSFYHNGHYGFRGLLGGSNRSLRFEDGPGAPLAKLNIDAAQVFGRDSVDFVLSIPADNGHGHGLSESSGLEHHPYLLLASATDGTFLFKGTPVPLGRDAVMTKFFRQTTNGALAGFRGALDHNADAAANISVSQLATLLGPNPPAKVYFAYVVLAMDGSEVEFVSNRFTVNLIP